MNKNSLLGFFFFFFVNLHFFPIQSTGSRACKSSSLAHLIHSRIVTDWNSCVQSKRQATWGSENEKHKRSRIKMNDSLNVLIFFLSLCCTITNKTHILLASPPATPLKTSLLSYISLFAMQEASSARTWTSGSTRGNKTRSREMRDDILQRTKFHCLFNGILH